MMMKQQIPSDLLSNCAPLRGALDDLLGEGRWSMGEDLGWAPLRFPAAPKIRREGVEPARVEVPRSYHLDGSWYQHHLFCPQQAIIVCPVLTGTALGAGGTALKLGSHFAMAEDLAQAEAEGGMDHASLCRRAQALDVERYPELEIYCEAGDVLLLHPHVAHSSTTNVRCGAPVRLALTKRAYWVAGPAPSVETLAPVELAMSWAALSPERPPLGRLLSLAEAALAEAADGRVLRWRALRAMDFEVPFATKEDVDALLQDDECDLGGRLLSPQLLASTLTRLARPGRLQRLGLARCGLGPAGACALGKALRDAVPAPRELLLQGNCLGDGGVVGLLAAAGRSLGAVEVLSLSGNGLSAVAAEALAAAAAPGLGAHLKLSENRIGPEGAHALAALAHRCGRLELRGCPLQDSFCAALKEQQNCSLEALDLEATGATDASCGLIAELFAAQGASAPGPRLKLVRLSLRGCRVTDAGARALAREAAGRLCRLDLGRNAVGDAGLEALAHAGGGELLLGTNRVGDRGFLSLLGAAEGDESWELGFVNLTSNLLTSTSVDAAAAFLRQRAASGGRLGLLGLDLTYNDASVASVRDFRAAAAAAAAVFPQVRACHFTAGCG
ncbi:unnamed protein product [Effrenium voratum]|nr:unnamed protein product [Effrenium voratum]